MEFTLRKAVYCVGGVVDPLDIPKVAASGCSESMAIKSSTARSTDGVPVASAARNPCQGWNFRRHLPPYPRRARAGLVLACADLLPSPAVTLPDAVDLACAMEMFHEASLVHDDICDGSVLRPDAPSVPPWLASTTTGCAP